MADEQHPDEAELSKRERQKARRQKRLEAERAAAAKAQRRRIGGFVLVGVLIAGTVGFFVQQRLAERRAEQEMIAAAQENLEELGCTEVQEMPSQGEGHFEGPELAENPPAVVYEHLPTTSGRHIANWVMTGVFDEYIDERLTTHNLEHGYVVIWYDEEADPAQVEELKEFAQSRIDEGDEELIVAPYNQPLDDDANFAYVSWERRQLCDEFDPGIGLAFINENMNHQRAPEAVVGPHLGDGDGLDPAEDQVVLPPLDAEDPSIPARDAAPEMEDDEDEDDEDDEDS